MVIHYTGNIPKYIPNLAILAMQESILHQKRQVASTQLKHQDKDPCTQPSEPILFPKLRSLGIKPPQFRLWPILAWQGKEVLEIGVSKKK